jgi:hypothetical protein
MINSTSDGWILRRLLAGAAMLGLCLFVCGCGSTPQVLDDEETYSTVDALWTAVTSKRTDLVDKTAARLASLHAEGKLSKEGLAALEQIIAQTRNNEWMPAAQDLKAFIQAQRKTRTTAK